MNPKLKTFARYDFFGLKVFRNATKLRSMNNA